MTSSLHRLAACCLAASLVAACGGHTTTFVEADDAAALGRVVVYRNGIAFYERHAKVVGDSLTLTVPHDKVDDFLKSLTVSDAKTGEALPVSFPTRGATYEGKVDMTIQIPTRGTREVVLTYITESPAWKPSYRVVVGADGEVDLQGWAIVDNTSGENWEGVRVGVGASSALSFRYDLRSVRVVHRETLDRQDRFAVAPPRGGSTHNDREHETLVVSELADARIPRSMGHPDLAEPTLAVADLDESPDGAGGAARGAPGAKPEERKAGPPAMDRGELERMAVDLNRRRGRIVIEGYARPGDDDTVARSADRANELRNRLIEAGVAPARLQVAAKGLVAGRDAGVRLVEVADPSAPKADGTRTLGDGDPVGESHFESKSPMDVLSGTSAMVAILDGAAEGEVVYLYDAEAERGHERFAFRSLRLVNPSDSTLEAGPVTVYGEGRFVGEGIADPIPPGATAIIPFALDRQVIVDRSKSTGDRISRLVTLQRGVLTTEVKHARTTRLKITNRSRSAADVFARHTVRAGWSLAKSPEIYERFGEAHLFRLQLGPGDTEVLELVEETPMTRTLDLRTPTGIAMVRAYLTASSEAPELAGELRALLAVHAEVENLREAIATTRQRAAEFRVRMDELHVQIASLDRVRGGSSLRKHLQTKMKDMSNRVQEATIDLVDMQERLMLARIRFQDGIAELTLARKAPTGDTEAPSAG